MSLSTLATDAYILADGIGMIDPSAPPVLGDKVNLILSWIIWGAVIACVIGMIFAGGYLAYGKMTGSGGDAQGKLIGVCVGAVIVASAGTLINTLVL